MKKNKKIIAILGVVALISGLLLDFKDIKEIFNKQTDISGEWHFEFRTNESTYNDYINSKTEYKMHIIQKKEEILGSGETWKYNGKLLPYSRHRPLEIIGTVDKKTIICKYKLKGKLRETTGSFKANYKNGELTGTFSGTGANVKGSFYAKKIN